MHRSGCSFLDASGEFCLPSLRVLSLNASAIKKKVSVAARQSVHSSERSPTLPSSSGLCVRQIENEQQSTVGEVSQPLKVMALASTEQVRALRSAIKTAAATGRASQPADQTKSSQIKRSKTSRAYPEYVDVAALQLTYLRNVSASRSKAMAMVPGLELGY